MSTHLLGTPAHSAFTDNLFAEAFAAATIGLGWVHLAVGVLPLVLTTVLSVLGIWWYCINILEYRRTHRRHEPATREHEPPSGG